MYPYLFLFISGNYMEENAFLLETVTQSVDVIRISYIEVFVRHK